MDYPSKLSLDPFGLLKTQVLQEIRETFEILLIILKGEGLRNWELGVFGLQMSVARLHFVAQVLEHVKQEGKEILSIETRFLLKKSGYISWQALFFATKTRKLFRRLWSQSKSPEWTNSHAPNCQAAEKSNDYIVSLTDLRIFSSFELNKPTKGLNVSSELKKVNKDFKSVKWLKIDRIANCILTLGL